MTTSSAVFMILGLACLFLWLFWPRKPIPMGALCQVVHHYRESRSDGWVTMLTGSSPQGTQNLIVPSPGGGILVRPVECLPDSRVICEAHGYEHGEMFGTFCIHGSYLDCLRPLRSETRWREEAKVRRAAWSATQRRLNEYRRESIR